MNIVGIQLSMIYHQHLWLGFTMWVLVGIDGSTTLGLPCPFHKTISSWHSHWLSLRLRSLLSLTRTQKWAGTHHHKPQAQLQATPQRQGWPSISMFPAVTWLVNSFMQVRPLVRFGNFDCGLNGILCLASISSRKHFIQQKATSISLLYVICF